MEASGKQDLWTRQALQSEARYGPGSRAAPGTFGERIWGILHPLSIFQRAFLCLIAFTTLCFLRASAGSQPFSHHLTQASVLLPSVSLLMDGGTSSSSDFRFPIARVKLASLISQSRSPSFPPRSSAVSRTRVDDGPRGPTWPGAAAALCSPGAFKDMWVWYLSPAGNPGWQSSRPLWSLESHLLLDAL